MSTRITPGERIGPYEIIGWLGAGGMGEVYRARDARLGRDVAIKLIAENLAGDGNRVRRFEQEARAAGQLNHPNILAVYDIGTHAGVPYIVSELLQGESLRSRLKGGAMSARKAADYARQIAEGLAAAHDRGIVHRDVKPDNLFITNDNRIKILDFGIAKLTLPDEALTATGMPTDTGVGIAIGTAGYMSPEQVRGTAVDSRSDIFSVGSVLFEMLAGRPAFTRGTAVETMAAVLNDDPVDQLPPTAPPTLVRIVARCMEKAREARFQSARDLAFGFEVLTGTTGTAAAGTPQPRRRWVVPVMAAVIVSALVALAIWLRPAAETRLENPLANAKISSLTDFDGSELDASISPDGRFVVFLSDRDGPFHVWLKQIGAGGFHDLTPGQDNQLSGGPVRSVGFTGDGGEIWLGGGSQRIVKMPLIGGAPRAFLPEHTINAAWSVDGLRVAYFIDPGDPLIVADRDGTNPRTVLAAKPNDHNHFPVWSRDGRWLYYAHGNQSLTNYDIWRIPSSGGTPEQLTTVNTDIRYLTMLHDDRTLLYVAPDENRSGPWLWALDVERKTSRRVSAGLERYLSIAADADGRRLVATVATSTPGLWTVPIGGGIAETKDVKPYSTLTTHAMAPRFGPGSSLFYLSSNGVGAGLWRLLAGEPNEIWPGSDEPLLESPAVSLAGDRAAIVSRRQGRPHLTMISADGTNPVQLADSITIQGAPTWSPDGKFIAAGGSDADGAGLFKIPIDGSKPTLLARGPAADPVWSSSNHVIVYVGPQSGFAPLAAVRDDDGSPVKLPDIQIPGGGRGLVRFMPDGNRLIYLRRDVGRPDDFWQLDMTTNQSRQLTRIAGGVQASTFDITSNGSSIVFDRLLGPSNIALIDLPKPASR